MSLRKRCVAAVGIANLTLSPVARLLGYRVGFNLLDPDNPAVRQRVLELEAASYRQAGIGDQAEGEKYFSGLYRGAKVRQLAVHLGIHLDGKVVAYFAVFEPEDFLFAVSREAWGKTGAVCPPIFVYTKLFRHPTASRALAKTQALRVFLALVTAALAARKHGFLLETRAQPDTRRLLRPGGPLDVVFPGVVRLVEELDGEGEQAPTILLYKFPSLLGPSGIRFIAGLVRYLGRRRKRKLVVKVIDQKGEAAGDTPAR